ncbi:UNVERIFIED_CONTAM: hypothetical protein Scaly_0839600 [Sesamum calycinum]|uniref:Retrotransposon gag domain-containing protein n=1 Tax=Sesamum calycinum TaxID=2727403 RepID=A0AAW2RAH7_9LAMI
MCQQTMPTKCGILFSEHIMAEELLARVRAPSHLSAYDGTFDSAEHIHKFENAALLHRYTDGIKCRVFVTTLTNSAQHWFDQLPDGSIKSFGEFSSLFQHQFSSKKYCKAVISLFGVKQEENETLKAYFSRFNRAIFEVPTAHQEVLVNAFTQDFVEALFLWRILGYAGFVYYEVEARVRLFIFKIIIIPLWCLRKMAICLPKYNDLKSQSSSTTNFEKRRTKQYLKLSY